MFQCVWQAIIIMCFSCLKKKTHTNIIRGCRSVPHYRGSEENSMTFMALKGNSITTKNTMTKSQIYQWNINSCNTNGMQVK